MLVIILFLSIVSPDFLTADNLFNVGSQVAYTAVMAIGVTLVIITAGIDLSVGSVAALSGVLGVMMMGDLGLPVPLGILGGTLVGAGAGLVNGLLISVAGLNPLCDARYAHRRARTILHRDRRGRRLRGAGLLPAPGTGGVLAGASPYPS